MISNRTVTQPTPAQNAGTEAISRRDAARLAEAVAHLDRITDWRNKTRTARRDNLDAPHDLAARLGHPERNLRCIHVTGTKGKSSTCALIETALYRAGLRVGRYASPHVDRINERISLNCTPVEDAPFANALETVLQAVEMARIEDTPGKAATWFDIMTLTAFEHFRAAGAEWAIIEAGIGGRLDSTNILTGDIAIITNVELEHTETLGKTRAAIALEKAGIVKPGMIAVTPLDEDDEAGSVIAARARQVGARLIRPSPAPGLTIAGRNARLADAALDALRESLASQDADDKRLHNCRVDETIMAAARLPGRMQHFKQSVAGSPTRDISVVLDGAHVPFNLKAVLADLKTMPDLSGPYVCVFSCASDKDAEGLLGILATEPPVNTILTRAAERSRDPSVLAAIAVALELHHSIEHSPAIAYEQALHFAAQNDCWVFITGSLYMAEAIARPRHLNP